MNDRYPYSGHGALMGLAEYPWQDTDYVFRYFGRSERTARQAYLAAMEARLGMKRPDLTGSGLLRCYGSWEEVRTTSRTERIKGDERLLGDTAFVVSAPETSAALSDLLIAHSARHLGCESILTFDKEATKSGFFLRVRSSSDTSAGVSSVRP